MIWTAALLVALASPPALAGNIGYPLGPGDVLRLVFSDREDLTGDYVVREDGRVSMHVLGTLDASDTSVVEFEELLRQRYHARTGFDASVTVEVAHYRPVYVLGDVNSPGAYGFVPGLNVMQALALAGGGVRLLLPQGESTILRVSEELNQIETIRLSLAEIVVERARLLAEAAGEQRFDETT